MGQTESLKLICISLPSFFSAMTCFKSTKFRGPVRLSHTFCKLFVVLLVHLAESQGTDEKECHNGSLFGRWSHDQDFLNGLAQEFRNAKPFPNVVIPGFFSQVSSRCQIPYVRALALPHSRPSYEHDLRIPWHLLSGNRITNRYIVSFASWAQRTRMEARRLARL